MLDSIFCKGPGVSTLGSQLVAVWEAYEPLGGGAMQAEVCHKDRLGGCVTWPHSLVSLCFLCMDNNVTSPFFCYHCAFPDCNHGFPVLMDSTLLKTQLNINPSSISCFLSGYSNTVIEMKTFGQSMNFYIKHKINNVGIALVNKGNNY